MSWVDIVGYSAALAVLAAFCMSSIVPLRFVATLHEVLWMRPRVPPTHANLINGWI
jgi:hypothetical protein